MRSAEGEDLDGGRRYDELVHEPGEAWSEDQLVRAFLVGEERKGALTCGRHELFGLGAGHAPLDEQAGREVHDRPKVAEALILLGHG